MAVAEVWLAKVETNVLLAVDVSVAAGADTVLSMPGNDSGSVNSVEVYGLENGTEGRISLSKLPECRRNFGSQLFSQSPYAW